MLLCKEMVNKQIVFFCALLYVSICTCKAQFSIGIDAGYNYNHLNTDIQNIKFSKITSEGGYSTGLQINYSLTKILSLQTGIDLLQKNYSFTRTGKYTGIYETFTNSYLQIPIAVKLRIFEKKNFQIFFKTGVYGAYWAFAKVNGTTLNIFNSTNTINSDRKIIQYLSITDYSENYQFNDAKDNRHEFGLNTGICIHYALNRKYLVLIESSYFQSFTDQQKKYMVMQFSKINQTLSISIGCLMTFPNLKKGR